MSESKEVDDVDQFGHPRIPYRGYYDKELCDKRRVWAERFSSSSLEHCGQWWSNEGSDDSCSCLNLKGNIENPIGLAKIPLAICGPLLINGEHTKGYYLCPFATTEGALVASITRGATALTRSGGVYVKVFKQNQIRSPYFRFRNLMEVGIFMKWMTNNFDHIKEKVHLFSQHAQLKKLSFSPMGRVIVVHFNYNTGDACGQNMVTSCTSQLCKWIRSRVAEELPQIKIEKFFIESGLSGDKSLTFINMWRTRGFHVQAEAWIPENVLNSVLKVDTATLISCFEGWKCFDLGRLGFSTNASNFIAGMFIATGQDVASIESYQVQLFLSPLSPTDWKAHEESAIGVKKSYGNIEGNRYAGVYASIVLPSLAVGTVGGGTNLATQKECLNLIGCYGKDGSRRLCEVIGGYTLGLELSTLSALASGQFASAHEKLGRNHPTHGFKDKDINEQFFSKIIGPQRKLLDATPLKVDTGNSILSEITNRELSKKVGHFGFTITCLNEENLKETIKVVIKSKTTAFETCNMLNKMAQACGHSLAVLYEKYKLKTGFNYCDICEVEIYRMKNMKLRKFFPKIYHTILQPSMGIFVIVMEYLNSSNYTHLNTVNRIEEWSIADIKIVLRDLADLHSLYLGKTDDIECFKFLDKREVWADVELASLWLEFLKHAHHEFPDIWNHQRFKVMENAIANLDKINSTLSTGPLTLIHNDCNPRNVCLHKSLGGLDKHMCLYDWELATLDVPQRDLAEFLVFTLRPTTPLETWMELIEFYRSNLEKYSGVDYPIDRFIEVFNTVMYDFAIRRLLMYTMVHTFKDYDYLPRVVDSLFAYIDNKYIFVNSKL